MERDILENGKLSCAAFVSSVLYLNRLIKGVHATVDSTLRDLFEFGWVETDEMMPGSVLVWEKKDFGSGEMHGHVGFYVGDNMAISNGSFNSGIPIKHHYTYKDTRKIDKILWHPELD